MIKSLSLFGLAYAKGKLYSLTMKELLCVGE